MSVAHGGQIRISKTSSLSFLAIGLFLLSCFFQGIRWTQLGMYDSVPWADEAQSVLDHDVVTEFNFLGAYGHPGGTVIEGVIALHTLLHLSYYNSVTVFVTLFYSLIIVAATALAYALRKDTPWWLAVFGVLSLNWLYYFATPPTAVAAVLVAFLCLLTLYIYENRAETELPYLLLWGLISGMAVATRADIGAFSSMVFMALLIPHLKVKKVALLVGEALLAFVIFDPFMWFMPVQHLKDLLYKVTYHYAEYTPTHLGAHTVVVFSSFTFISIFLAVITILLQKRVKPLVPAPFVGMLLCMTAVLYVIFLSSHYQSIRYFLPITFIWEMFLPLFVFPLINAIEFSFIKTAHGQLYARKIFQWFIVAICFSYNFLFLMQDLLMANISNFLS